MKKLVIFAAAVWMTGGAYATGFDQQLSVNTKDLKVAAAGNKEAIAPSCGVQFPETDTQNLKQVKADLTRLLTVNLPDNAVRVESLKVSRFEPNGYKYYFEAKTIETGLVLSKRYTIKGIYDPYSTNKVELLEKTFEGAVN